MKSAVTVSLVPEARGGPFVFWDDLRRACIRSAELGFDGIEIFPPNAEAIDPSVVKPLLTEHRLALAAVGTGAGWVKHKLTLSHPDPLTRAKGVKFVKSIVEAAAQLGAPVIIGSMQGRAEGSVTREHALEWFGQAVSETAEFAERHGTFVLIEFLNRYETNLLNRTEQAAEFVQKFDLRNVRVLADLFHMNIEESSIEGAIRTHAGLIGHVHFADSNRKAAGLGHIPLEPIIGCLRETGYRGYLSAEVLPLPDSDTAAERTIRSFRELLS